MCGILCGDRSTSQHIPETKLEQVDVWFLLDLSTLHRYGQFQFSPQGAGDHAFFRAFLTRYGYCNCLWLVSFRSQSRVEFARL